MIAWTAVFAASLSWLFADELVTSPRPLVQWALIGVAWVMAAWDARRRPAATVGSRWGWAFIALVAASVLAAPSHRPALWLVGFGIAGGRWVSHRRARNGAEAGVDSPSSSLVSLATAARHVGLLLMIQAPLYWIYAQWTARNVHVPLVAEVLRPVLAMFGCDVGTSGGVLYLNTPKITHEFPITWNHLAAYPAWLLLAGGLALVHLRGDRPARSVVKLTAMVPIYLLLRLATVITLFASRMLFVEHDSERVHVEMFWIPQLVTVSLLPLLPILAWICPLESRVTPADGRLSDSDRPVPRPRIEVAWATSVVVAVVALVAALHLPDPGVKKSGRILVDEAHSEWEKTNRLPDRDWYGTESGYSYGAMADYLDRHFDFRRHDEGKITPEVLEGCDVLFLKTPTIPYDADEVAAIEDFVHRGGGLLAFGEHSDVWGSSTHLAPVLRPFGIALRYDCVFDVDRQWEQLHEISDIGRHPAVGSIPFFLFAVSCSIQADSWTARPMLQGRGLWTLPIAYSSANFYPVVTDRTDAVVGVFDQAVAQTHGKGRVIAFADSTVYSNFDAFSPGKSELLLHSVDWLDRTNARTGLRTALFVTAAVAGLAALVGLIAGIGRLPLLLATTVAATTAASIGSFGCDVLRRASYPIPTPHTAMRTIAFEVPHADAELAIYGFQQQPRKNYDVFYQWALRADAFPRAALDWDEAFEADVVVLTRPRGVVTSEQRDRMGRFLEAGGSVLLLEAPGRDDSIANDLLASYDMEVGATPCRGESLIVPPHDATVGDLRGDAGGRQGVGSVAVKGGEPLLSSSKGEVVAAWRRVGKGTLVVAGIASVLTTPAMGGHYSKVPDEKLRARYELVFALYQGLLDGNVAETVGEVSARYAE